MQTLLHCWTQWVPTVWTSESVCVYTLSPVHDVESPGARATHLHCDRSLIGVRASRSATASSIDACCAQVRVAQQAGDAACLAHALAALCGLLTDSPPGPPAVPGTPPPPPYLRHDVQLRRLLRV